MFFLPSTRAIGLCALAASVAQAHTLVRAVWINGVDQGTNIAVRHPGFTGPPGPDWWGYDGNPVKNLTSLDMRCNRLGEFPAADTVKVLPGDIVTFEWGHGDRMPTDDIIADSHHGPVLVYIAPNPPVGEPWVKIFEEGEYEKGKWAATHKLIGNRGMHSIQIPAGLKPGQYLLRPELITLHEAETTVLDNPARGVQLYMECVQIEVIGNGTVELPNGVDFPGAYDYRDPGINYNIYWTPDGAPPYTIPGPPLWSGAAPSIANPSLGEKKGVLTGTPWTHWVVTEPLPTMYYSLYTGTDGNKTTVSSTYTATWPTPTLTATTTVVAPESTSSPASTEDVVTTPAATSIVPSSTVEAPPTTPAPVEPPASTTTVKPVPPTPTATVCSKKGPKKGEQCGGRWYKGPTTCRDCRKCVKLTGLFSYCK